MSGPNGLWKGWQSFVVVGCQVTAVVSGLALPGLGRCAGPDRRRWAVHGRRLPVTRRQWARKRQPLLVGRRCAEVRASRPPSLPPQPLSQGVPRCRIYIPATAQSARCAVQRVCSARRIVHSAECAVADAAQCAGVRIDAQSPRCIRRFRIPFVLHVLHRSALARVRYAGLRLRRSCAWSGGCHPCGSGAVGP